jgi:hypothetical protein
VNTPRIVIACAVLLCTPLSWAVDRADLDATSIIGNRELPKVLYIVPWKQPISGDLVGRPVNSLLDEALAPVDREVFQREVQYHSLIHGGSAPAQSQSRNR